MLSKNERCSVWGLGGVFVCVTSSSISRTKQQRSSWVLDLNILNNLISPKSNDVCVCACDL